MADDRFSERRYLLLPADPIEGRLAPDNKGRASKYFGKNPFEGDAETRAITATSTSE